MHKVVILLVFLIFTFPVAAQTDLLEQAENALWIGDYDSALQHYSTLLSDETLRCDALMGLGTTYFRAARYAEAESMFTDFINACPQPVHIYVMRGQTRVYLEKSTEAVEDYRLAIESQGDASLNSYLYERMAALDTNRVVEYLRAAADSPRSPEAGFLLREKIAQIYLLAGNQALALEAYTTLLREIEQYLTVLSEVEGATFDVGGNLRARLEMAAAEIEIASGQGEAGYVRLQRIISNYPETDSALPALILLVNTNQPVDLLLRTRINVLNENYRPVVGVLTDYLAQNPNAPVELYVLFGRAQRGQGDVEGALRTFQQVLELYPDDLFASTAALEIAQTHVQTGNGEEALEAFTSLAANYPQSSEAPIALLGAAEIELTTNPQVALSRYEQLATAYSDTEQVQSAIFDAARSLITQDPTLAASLFGRVGTAKGFVWQGNVLQQNGDAAGAQAAWQQSTRAEPGTYFAMRGCELLNNQVPFAPSNEFQLTADTPEDRTQAAQWVSQTFGLENVSAELSPELVNDPMLRRGTALWVVGLWSEARAEFDALHKLKRDDPVALLQLAFYYYDRKIYRSSLFSATRLVFFSERPFTQIPRSILQLAYPFYYSDLIAETARSYELDPLLVAALIRQETSFDATAVSIADARGMMQLLPSTAQDVATRMGLTNYTENDLYRPMVNIPMGVYYLRSMLDFQNGSVAGALLSYNAGPGAALSWLNEAGDDLDVLYETIDFNETKQYLEFIYQNYMIYRYLYSSDTVPACMFEGVIQS